MLTTTYINVNFNKILETLIFQQSYVQYLKSSNKLSKAEAALVNSL